LVAPEGAWGCEVGVEGTSGLGKRWRKEGTGGKWNTPARPGNVIVEALGEAFWHSYNLIGVRPTGVEGLRKKAKPVVGGE